MTPASTPQIHQCFEMFQEIHISTPQIMSFNRFRSMKAKCLDKEIKFEAIFGGSRAREGVPNIPIVWVWVWIQIQIFSPLITSFVLKKNLL